MRVDTAPKFRANLLKFPLTVQKKLAKQIDFLVKDLRHPSLRAKKYDESRGIWQGRVDRNVRFYFLINGSRYILLNIKKHSK